MAGTANPYGIVAEFDNPADTMHAEEKVRDAGFRKWDVFTPFPVHGMDKAMGLKNSKVGWFSFLGGVTGYTGGMLMIWWMNAVDYPILVQRPDGSYDPEVQLANMIRAPGIGPLGWNQAVLDLLKRTDNH